MALDGIFNATMELKLVNCGSLPPFAETVEFQNLHGASLFSVNVEVPSVSSACSATPACIDVAKHCGKNPRFIVLRPMSVQFKEKVLDPNSTDIWGPPGAWMALDASGISRDELAKHLTFNKPGGKGRGLGRAQFYYDGLLDLLIEEKNGGTTQATIEHQQVAVPIQDAKDCNSQGTTTVPSCGSLNANATLTFCLKKWVIEKDEKPYRKLHAVTVQFIAGYGMS